MIYMDANGIETAVLGFPIRMLDDRMAGVAIGRARPPSSPSWWKICTGACGPLHQGVPDGCRCPMSSGWLPLQAKRILIGDVVTDANGVAHVKPQKTPKPGIESTMLEERRCQCHLSRGLPPNNHSRQRPTAFKVHRSGFGELVHGPAGEKSRAKCLAK